MFAFGLVLGYRTGASPLAVLAAFGLVVAFAFGLCWGVHGAGDGRPRAALGSGAVGDDHAAADVRQLGVVPDVHHARLAAGLRRGLPRLPGPPTPSAPCSTARPPGPPRSVPPLTSAVVVAVFAPLSLRLPALHLNQGPGSQGPGATPRGTARPRASAASAASGPSAPTTPSRVATTSGSPRYRVPAGRARRRAARRPARRAGGERPPAEVSRPDRGPARRRCPGRRPPRPRAPPGPRRGARGRSARRR